MMPMPDHDDALLDYETEAEAPPAPGPAYVPVAVCEPVVTVPTVGQHVTCVTFTLTAAAPVAQVLALDALRVVARLRALDNPVVLCHSVNQAQDSRNADVALAAPDGFVLPTTSMTEVATTAPLWVAANTFPSRVSVIIERRT